MSNPLTRTDVYKLGHMMQYRPGTTSVYNYLATRKVKDRIKFFGLQYYLKKYLTQKITEVHSEAMIQRHQRIIGSVPEEFKEKIRSLASLGYWPVRIKAVPEGTVIPTQNVLFTTESTDERFYWAGGYLESLLLKIWYPSTVASTSLKYKEVVDTYFNMTSDLPLEAREFYVHDFGYRSDSSEESAAISGAAHLLNFKGSDTIPALDLIDEFYPEVDSAPGPWMMSVPASEHSVACSYPKEMDFFRRQLELYPSGFVSIISDTYDVYRVLSEFSVELRDSIVNRDGKTVFRPDSGNPEHIINGNPEAPYGTPEYRGALDILKEVFGTTRNSKGFKVLNPRVGLIYGDAMYLERYTKTLEVMRRNGFSAENLVIGVGGILRSGTRDSYGFFNKASHVEHETDGGMDIAKNPVTDTKKKSFKGKLSLHKNPWRTEYGNDETGELVEVFKNGRIMKSYPFSQVIQNGKQISD